MLLLAWSYAWSYVAMGKVSVSVLQRQLDTSCTDAPSPEPWAEMLLEPKWLRSSKFWFDFGIHF